MKNPENKSTNAPTPIPSVPSVESYINELGKPPTPPMTQTRDYKDGVKK